MTESPAPFEAETTPEPAGDTYEAPAHGWTCFHCGETFPSTMEGHRRAQDHFGGDLLALAGCQIKAGEERGLLLELRRLEAELIRYRGEDSDTDRAMAAMQSEHAMALRREEEKGYARGIRDAWADPPAGWKLVPVEPPPEMYCAGDEAIIKALEPIVPAFEPTPAQLCYRAMLAVSPAAMRAGIPRRDDA